MSRQLTINDIIEEVSENGEAGKYSQSITLFNAAFSRWRNWYNRAHMAKDPGTFRF